MYALHKTNPEYWDETRLSQAFQMRKINVRANLILKEREDVRGSLAFKFSLSNSLCFWLSNL